MEVKRSSVAVSDPWTSSEARLPADRVFSFIYGQVLDRFKSEKPPLAEPVRAFFEYEARELYLDIYGQSARFPRPLTAVQFVVQALAYPTWMIFLPAQELVPHLERELNLLEKRSTEGADTDLKEKKRLVAHQLTDLLTQARLLNSDILQHARSFSNALHIAHSEAKVFVPPKIFFCHEEVRRALIAEHRQHFAPLWKPLDIWLQFKIINAQRFAWILELYDSAPQHVQRNVNQQEISAAFPDPLGETSISSQLAIELARKEPTPEELQHLREIVHNHLGRGA